jgi:G:T/U-mismatch repair DNA glycosylase
LPFVSPFVLVLNLNLDLNLFHLMIPSIWPNDLTVLFVGTVVSDLSDTLGFHHIHPKDRLWELLENSAITPKRILTKEDCKAMIDGHKFGNVSEPVRLMFIEKKTSQLLKLGIGLTDLNRRMIASTEKDKATRPNEDDVRDFVAKAGELNSKVLAFIMNPDIFVESFKSRFPEANTALGLQPFKIGSSEVWLLGSTIAMLRGEALTQQEDAFFALGERVEAIKNEIAAN